MIHSLPFCSQWKTTKETFEVSLLCRSCEFEALKWVWKLSAIFTLPCWQVSLTCTLEFDKESAKSGSASPYSSTNTYLRPWIRGVGACSWYWRNSQSMKKISKICPESHIWEQLKEVGCSHLSKTSLMKRYCVPNSELATGGQNCSVAPDSESATGEQNLGAGMNKLMSGAGEAMWIMSLGSEVFHCN